jgi:hypothetical protein
LRDGFAGQSPELREEVKALQLLLQKAGQRVEADGLFGEGTLHAVKSFQRDHGLQADGVVGAKTWQALQRGEGPTGQAVPASSGLEGFRGDLGWIHAREGHAGKAYWPGGASGVTLDPGVDLGYADPSMIEAAYRGLLTPEQFSAVEKVFGIKGESAKVALAKDSVLQGIRISRTQANTIFAMVVEPYWQRIVGRFPALAHSDTLPSVQTAMLSLAYNRGAQNRGLEALRQPLDRKEWSALADAIGSMQQDHRLEGIRKRRRMEADLIRGELA